MSDICVKWPIVNPLWDYKRFSLRKYLVDLNVVEPYDTTLTMYEGVYEFYIRMAYGRNYEILLPKTTSDYKQRYDEFMNNMERDPWNRPFKCFPSGLSTFSRMHVDSNYDFQGHYILDESINGNNTTIKNHYDCYVITTTVEGEIVYCLDLMTK